MYSWWTLLSRRATEFLSRGCPDLSDPEERRRTAVTNVTALAGCTVTAVFTVINLLQGHYRFAAVILAALLAMWLSVLLHHRTRDQRWGYRLGVSTAGVLLLYALASGGSDATGFVWTPMFPLVAIAVMGRTGGTVFSAIHLALAALIMLVPGLPGVTAAYPLPLAARLIAATLFAGTIAFHFDRLGQVARSRLRAEIDVRKRAEQELRASEEMAVRGSKAKSDFLATLSHEVRTPLTAVMALNDALLRTELDGEQRRLAQLASQSGRSLVGIMEDILDLAQVEAGALAVQSVPFDLHALTAQIVDLEGALAADRPVSVELDWHPESPRLVRGDPARLRQVLVNLTSNALKFTAQGSVVLRVQSSDDSTANGTDVLFSVDDSGVGLPEALHEAVFEPFARGDAARAAGSGLGLAISKRLVEAMDGEIGVCSPPGGGTTFWVRLPLPAAPEEDVYIPTPPMARFAGRVLLVEDNDLNRDVLRMMLERFGCDVQLAANGKEGVDAFTAGRFDLVLMDCRMPVLDGYEAARQMRGREGGGGRTPIVAITAHTLPEDIRRSLDAGMDDQLNKPVLPEDLIATLARWLPPAMATSAARASA